MWTPISFFMGPIRIIGVVALALLVTPFESAQSARSTSGSSSGKVVGIGSLSFGGTGKCDVPPTWKGPIRGKKRWVPTYFDKKGKPHAYCDRQTGIVIQATPGEPPDFNCGNDVPCNWYEARFYCTNLTVGDSGQKGWRLLYIPELAALVDTNSKSCTDDNLCLPDGHPFKDVPSSGYWSASTLAENPDAVWILDLATGLVNADGKVLNEGVNAWCGRGASATDTY